ncbi:helix-turn-helix domain-containing protein [Serratia proteamaculans]|uniref:helix-turn-helix domain-containing protein n=1 Tax=Serratia proteamaculans TaxID=28151 RepID=UPI001C59673A|nr:helix-turn-helix transcriptional regulator [Serratia proteamaculans]WEO91523.1 helix-turn-helix transcriptional regulator [Serratia proteamaculans]
MCTLGARLREERNRLGLTQAELAEIVGIHKNSQGNYENDVKSPDSKYLSMVAEHGIDILYVVTGVKTPQPDVSVEELKLIENYRAMDDAARLNIQAVGDSFAQSKPKIKAGNN